MGPKGIIMGVEKASSNIVTEIKSRRLTWAKHLTRMEDDRSAFKILTGKSTGRRPLGRPKRKCGDNVKMDRKEIRV